MPSFGSMKFLLIFVIFSLFQGCISTCILQEERNMNLYYNQTFSVQLPTYNSYALQLNIESTIDIPILVTTQVDKMKVNLIGCYPWEPILYGNKFNVEFQCIHSICNFVYSVTVTHVYSMTPFGLARKGMIVLSVLSFFIILALVICVTVYVVLQLKKKFVVDRV
jgi:hypothetical protein